MASNKKDWSRVLPFILLGLRSTLREEFLATPAELLYGENIRLPCDFLQESTNSFCQSDFVNHLRKVFSHIRPVQASNHSVVKFFKFKDLDNCSHVFLRTDSVKAPLQCPYEGPFEIVSRSKNYFAILIKGKEVKVSLNRLKPCFLESDAQAYQKNNTSISETVTQPCRTLTQGQPVSDDANQLNRRPAFSTHLQQSPKKVRFNL